MAAAMMMMMACYIVVYWIECFERCVLFLVEGAPCHEFSIGCRVDVDGAS
jgi:hypothetical protein